jgi:hypothetical protein
LEVMDMFNSSLPNKTKTLLIPLELLIQFQDHKTLVLIY